MVRTGVVELKSHGYIRPTPATADLWWSLTEAKQRQDYAEVGRLSALIRTETQRNGQPNNSAGVSLKNYDL